MSESETKSIKSNRNKNSTAEDNEMATSYTEIAYQLASVGQNRHKNHMHDDVEQDQDQDDDDVDEDDIVDDEGDDDDERSSATNPNSDNLNKDGSIERLACNGNNYGSQTRQQKRPATLVCDKSFPYDLEGTVRREGDMTHFVAENLEYKIKLSSPVTKQMNHQNFSSKNSTPSTSTSILQKHFLQSQLAQIDSSVLSDIEIDAQYLAASVDNLTENLYNLLHSVSSITADNVEIHKNSVNKLTDSMDSNIKCMYTIMAKTEEISKSMKPTEQLALRIREIKRLVDMLENSL